MRGAYSVPPLRGEFIGKPQVTSTLLAREREVSGSVPGTTSSIGSRLTAAQRAAAAELSVGYALGMPSLLDSAARGGAPDATAVVVGGEGDGDDDSCIIDLEDQDDIARRIGDDDDEACAPPPEGATAGAVPTAAGRRAALKQARALGLEDSERSVGGMFDTGARGAGAPKAAPAAALAAAAASVVDGGNDADVAAAAALAASGGAVPSHPAFTTGDELRLRYSEGLMTHSPIVIIRHGKTEHNKLGLFTGQCYMCCF